MFSPNRLQGNERRFAQIEEALARLSPTMRRLAGTTYARERPSGETPSEQSGSVFGSGLSSLPLGGDLSGTTNEATVEAAQGIEFPEPVAGDDALFLTYDHAAGAYVLSS